MDGRAGGKWQVELETGRDRHRRGLGGGTEAQRHRGPEVQRQRHRGTRHEEGLAKEGTNGPARIVAILAYAMLCYRA